MISKYSRYYDRWHTVIKNRGDKVTPASELWELRRQVIGGYLTRCPNIRSALDLGCGVKDYFEYFSAQTRVIGMDISLEAVKLCRLKARPGAKFVVASAENIPFKDKRLDAVIMDEVIEHIENVDKTLRDIQRILTAGGKLIVSTPNRHRYIAILKIILPIKIWRVFSQFKNGRYPTSALEKEDSILAGYGLATHQREFSCGELKRWLRKSGFIPDEIRGVTCHFPPPVIYNYLVGFFPSWHNFWKKMDVFSSRIGLCLKSNLIIVARKNG